MKNKSVLELYNRLENGLKDIEEENRANKYEEICAKFFNPANKQRLRKTRRIYSIEVEGQANYIVKRKSNTYQALRSKDIATPTYIINDDIISIEYYSKNAIPLSITKLLKILQYKNVDKKHIYDKEIQDISKISIDAQKYIKYLKYIFSESGRVRISVVLNKSAFQDINFNNMIENATYNIKDEAVKDLVENYINNTECPVFQFIGKPRPDGKQLKIYKQTADYITLAYPKQIDKEFKKLVKEIYETYSD